VTDRPDQYAALPPVEAIDGAPDAALPAIALHLAALQARVAVRMAAMAVRSNGRAPIEPPYTLHEAATLVLKSPAWLRRLAKANRVPGARKAGKSWTFDRATFDRWRQRPQIG